MLKSAGFRSYRIDAKSRRVNFVCRTREWALAIRLTSDCLNVMTPVCELPKEYGVGGRRLKWVLQANRNPRTFGIVNGEDVLESLGRTLEAGRCAAKATHRSDSGPCPRRGPHAAARDFLVRRPFRRRKSFQAPSAEAQP